MFQSWWHLVQTCELGKCCSIPIPSVAPMWVYVATKFSLGHSQIWLLILCDVQVQFDRPLNFHCCSTLRERGHSWASSSRRNVEAARYEERQTLTNCSPETKIRKLPSLTATSKSADRLMDRVRTYCNQLLYLGQCTFTLYNTPYEVYLKLYLCDMNDYTVESFWGFSIFIGFYQSTSSICCFACFALQKRATERDERQMKRRHLIQGEPV